jgi:hypothetical protein
MKKFLIAAALAAGALVQPQPSEAYFRGAYCAKIDIGSGVVQEKCDFTSFASCYNYINSTPKSFCVQNQWSAPNWGIDENLDGNRFNRRFR